MISDIHSTRILCSLRRRFKLTYAALLIIATCAFSLLSACSQKSGMDALRQELHQYTDTLDARVGVALITQTGDTLTLNNDRPYIMMSVFKFHQSLTLCDYLHKHKKGLDYEVFLPIEEMSADTWSPLYKQMLEESKGAKKECYGETASTSKAAGKDITMADLLKFMVQLSDNNVSNFLFRHYVSPEQTDSFIRKRFGLADFTIRCTEQEMQKDKSLCIQNSTTPYCAALLLKTFDQGEDIAQPYKNYLLNLMENCRTGAPRLRQPFEGSTVKVAHKTGSGYTINNRLMAVNDIGIIDGGEKGKYYLAVFVNDSGYSQEASEDIIAHVSAIVAKHLGLIRH